MKNKMQNILLSFVFVVSSAFLALNLFGFKSNIVMSGSMEPVIHTGSIAFVDTHYNYNDLEVNDVAVFSSGINSRVIHRIVEETEDGFITQGDANESNDGLTVTKSTFCGKYMFSIPFLGYLISYLQNPPVLIGLASFIVIVTILNILFMKKGENKDESTKENQSNI